MTNVRFDLPTDAIPTAWFNALPRLPEPLQPPLHPGTKEPVGPDDLAPLFPMALIAQEMSGDKEVDIPGEVIDVYRLWRPTPLVRAVRLEQALGTPARIYFKDESVSPAGQPQAEHRRPAGLLQQGRRHHPAHDRDRRGPVGHCAGVRHHAVRSRVHGVHGPHLVRVEAVPARARWRRGARSACRRPSTIRPRPGSLGLAISDAVRDAATRDDSHYSLGSVLNHVLLHQTVIGLEAKEQLALAGETRPDVVIASCGGGSNLGGISLPFLEDADVRLVAVEPSSCPTLTEGNFDYDFGDTAGMTPLLPMFTLGHEFMPPPIHAGGLRYHGDSPIISLLVKTGRMEAMAYPQGKVFEAAKLFANTEGKVAAPETSHGIRAVIDEALAAKETGEERVILFNYSGHGLLDLAAYDDFNHGRLVDS